MLFLYVDCMMIILILNSKNCNGAILVSTILCLAYHRDCQLDNAPKHNRNILVMKTLFAKWTQATIRWLVWARTECKYLKWILLSLFSLLPLLSLSRSVKYTHSLTHSLICKLMTHSIYGLIIKIRIETTIFIIFKSNVLILSRQERKGLRKNGREQNCDII